MTPREAARMLGVSYATIKQWILSDKLKTMQTPGGHHRLTEATLKPFLQKDKMKAAVGDRIVVEAEKVGQSARTGVIEEVLTPEPPRLRVRWDDGHSTVFTPSAGAAKIEPAKR